MSTSIKDGKQSATESAQTKIVIGGRAEDQPVVTNKGKTLMIPSWIISLLQISAPAVIALGAMYIRVEYLAKDNEKLNSTVEVQEKEIIQIKSTGVKEVGRLNAKIDLLEVQQKNDSNRVFTGLDRIESQIKEYKTEMKEDMAVIQSDVKLLQRNLSGSKGGS